jgi:predicted restriction endonuclease
MPTRLSFLGAAEEPETFDRPIVEQFTSRLLRDAAFSEAVKAAYHNTCAITGLKIINGGWARLRDHRYQRGHRPATAPNTL